MERSRANLMSITSTSDSSKQETQLTLQSLNDDVIWKILDCLPLSDVLMVGEAVQAWNHITSDVLSKQQFCWCVHKIHSTTNTESVTEQWPEYNYYQYEYFGYCFINYPHRCVGKCGQSNRKDSIPIEWLQNEGLTKWKLLLERCPNLSRLYLYRLHDFSTVQLISILESVLALCNNLKSIGFQYYQSYSIVEQCARIYFYNEVLSVRKPVHKVYLFPWIPSWGSDYEKEIILTPKFLEQQSTISNSVLDCVTGILAKVRPYIRDPYWFGIRFQREILKDEKRNTCVAVAQLRCIKVGICQNKVNSRKIRQQLDKYTQFNSSEFDTYYQKLPEILELAPRDIENICSLFKQLEKLEAVERPLYRLEGFKKEDDAYLNPRIGPNDHSCKCICCCDHCQGKSVLAEWNSHWNTLRKLDWDWSEYKNWTALHSSQEQCVPITERGEDEMQFSRRCVATTRRWQCNSSSQWN